MLRYLDERGIRPGAELLLREAEPFGGPLVVEIEGDTHHLGEELARKMRVEPLQGDGPR
jgi:Fe2+ transport system protein FeoA